MTSPRFTLSQRFFFDAAHTLRREMEAEGSRRIHGHTYHAEVSVSGVPDAATGMVIDLGILRRHLDDVRERLDHHLLDEVPGLGVPTLEIGD
ncbi:MAG: 6-carboxytetrahydropterin synthase [Variovorax sp.]|nr:MAG: 6-carboxytetrahydropterin synthase [Variovorax sp.]